MPTLRGCQKVFTFSILFRSAKRSLQAARETEEGSFFEILNCLVMAAFTVEAYMNHLGKINFSNEFNKFEKANVWKKYQQLRNSCNLTEGTIKSAYPSVAGLLEFRNSMAHGKTEINAFERDVLERTIPLTLSQSATGWQGIVTLDYAESAIAGVEQMITELHEAAGQGSYPFLKSMSGLYSLSVTNTETQENPEAS